MTSLKTAVDDFMAAKSTRSQATQKFYASVLGQYVKHNPANWPPSTKNITAFLDSLQERELSKNTVAGYFRAIRAWINWLIEQGVIQESPLDAIDAPRPKKQKIPRAPARDTVENFFTELENDVAALLRRGSLADKWHLARDLAIVSFMVGSGSRVRETSWLMVDDVNLRNCLATMRQTKTGEVRDVGFSERVSADIRLWLSVRENILPLDLPFLWISRHRSEWRRFSKDGIRQMLRIRCERYNLPKITPHQLRHYWANHQVQNKASIYDISQQLGHGSIKTTEIYFYSAAQERQERLNGSSPR